MFIFYKMEYVIAYKMLLKESIDEKKGTFFGNVTGLEVGACHFTDFHVSLFGIDDTASLCLRCFFCNANVKYTSTFQCCYEQRLLFLSSLDRSAGKDRAALEPRPRSSSSSESMQRLNRRKAKLWELWWGKLNQTGNKPSFIKINDLSLNLLTLPTTSIITA